MNVSLGYGIGRVLGLAVVIGVVITAVHDPLTQAFLVVVVCQPRTFLRDLSIAAARILA